MLERLRDATRGASDEAPPPLAVLVTLLVLLGSLRLFFPGDVPFINDEPALVQAALEANESGTPASAGLLGTRGVRNGPAAIWFYQLSLALTHDLGNVALAKIAIVTSLTCVALVLIARAGLPVVPGLGAFALLSPYLWLYARDLWDNSFAIPLSAMLLAAYIRFCRDERLRWLGVAALFGTLCFLTHFMTLPLVGAVGLHFAATRWRSVAESPRFAAAVAGILVLCLVLALPYLVQLSGRSLTSFRWLPSPRPLAFSLNGLRLFTLAGFDYFIGPWSLGGSGPIVRLATLFSYVAGAVGLAVIVTDVRRGDRLRRQVASVLLLALALFVLVANGRGLTEHPHYYNGMWIVFFCIWWIGMSRLVREAWARRAFAVQVVVMLAFLVGLPTWIHQSQGTRSLRYGPTLTNQMAVAEELERLGVDGVPIGPGLRARLFPHAIGVLRELSRAEGAVGSPAVADSVEIVYADPEGRSGEIAVRRRSPPDPRS
jgi:hypothetical protein